MEEEGEGPNAVLPDEVLFHIFEWILSISSWHTGGVGQVNRRWRTIWNTDSLWIPFLCRSFPSLQDTCKNVTPLFLFTQL